MELTSAQRAQGAPPLAERLRPRTLAEFVGQQHLLGEKRALGELARRQQVHSMILWGPPGTGKTTLARLLANGAAARFLSISAVLAGVKEVREAVATARQYAAQGQSTILFVDEVHRFNKAQQDAFLPHVEKGTITFIGATTENPSFEVNPALLSRARVYVLKPLEEADLAILCQRGAESLKIRLHESAQQLLVKAADGDARRMLNVLDIAAQLAQDVINPDHVATALGDQVRRFDKGGDVFYEQISALHKSLRGSDPDAALYWFCRMLDGGADPRYLGRRLLRMASEDVGNADPRALELTLAAVTTYERLGSPEGDLALAQAVLYLASVPKSDAAYAAFNHAMDTVRNAPSFAVPVHLRNAPTQLMRELGFGSEYRHAHAEDTSAGAFAPGEDYFPDDMAPQQFYFPKTAGLEAKIQQRLDTLKALNRNAPQPRRQNPDEGDDVL
ncbi:MAG: replication-associated recombination protein A [bacterium]